MAQNATVLVTKKGTFAAELNYEWNNSQVISNQ